MVSFRTVVSTLAVAASVVVGELEYTEVQFVGPRRPVPEVVSGTMTDSCKGMLEAVKHTIKVPVGQEPLFKAYFGAACKGVSLKAKVMQYYKQDKSGSACAGKPRTVRFAPNNQLGAPIPGEKYIIRNYGVHCFGSGRFASLLVYRDLVCDVPVNPFVYGLLGATDSSVDYTTEPSRYSRQAVTIDFNNCNFTKTSFTAEEDQIFTA